MSALPKTHRAAVVVLEKDGFQFKIEERPLPVPGPQEVLVRLSATGVCGTDFALASGKLGPTRSILGHEGVGRVVALGSGITEAQVKLGHRVGMGWVRDVCGSCAMCMAEGGETRCLEMMNSGRKINGTFAEYTLVPYRYLMALPETLSDETIAPILCGGVTIYKALKICGATAGQWVVISGAGGGVGALGIQYAVAMGYRVVAIDGGQEKALYCEQMGAEVYINFMEEKDVPSRVILATDGCGANAALMVAGSGQAYQQAFQMMAPFGTIVCIGIPPPTDLVHFHPLTFIDKGIKLIGSAVGTRKDVLEALEFVKRGKVTPVVQTAQLEELNDIAAEFSTGKALGKYVINLLPSEEGKNLDTKGDT